MKQISVLLVEDHMIVREGLRALLSVDAGIAVVGEAQDGRQAVELAEQLRPNVVLMDIAMPLLNGIEATRQIMKSVPETKVLILSAHSDDEYIDRAVELGTAGFLSKQSSAESLTKAIREVHKGNRVYSPAVAKRLNFLPVKKSTTRRAPVPEKISRLTSREVELLQSIAEGKSNKQIALQCDISIKTVEKHRQNLMEKLDIHETAGLTRYAISAGIIENRVQVTIL